MSYPEKRSGFATSFILMAAVLLLVAGAVGFFVLEGSSSGPEKNVLIPRGSTITRVAERLHKEGVIKRPGLFKLLLRATNGEHRLRAGEFKFRAGMRPVDALFTLYHGEPILHAVTVPEGWSVRQIAAALARAGVADEKKFTDLALSPDTARKYRINGPSLEGFLFPDTYRFSRIDGEERILDAMVKHFFARFTDDYRRRAEAMGFTMVELVTLASIIEKETGVPSERRLISSVFHNRLKKKMRLQSDPTTIYGIANFNGNLTKKDLQTHTPYNTYRIRGLPPGPIANPGWESILAALDPANESYLYFVSNNQGAHVFSRTYEEHQRYVNYYQKSRAGRAPSKK